MQAFASKRLLLACVYLGILFLAAGTVFYTLQRFSGTVLIRQAQTERTVVRLNEGPTGLGVAQRNVPPDLLLLDNPANARVLRGDRTYDSAILPFTLRLDGAEIMEQPPPFHYLTVSGTAGEQKLPAETGAELALDGLDLTVDGVGPWSGLIRSPSSGPMAALSLGDGGTSARGVLFLNPGQWHLPQEDLAVAYHWHENESAAREAFASDLQEGSAARWGVRDGRAIQWMENFVPGTAVRLRDGTHVALREGGRSSGRVTLRVTGGGESRTVEVEANRASPESPYLFEDPAATGRILRIHAWREDRAVCRVIGPEGLAGERVLSPGGQWQLPPDGPRLHLRQIMAHAVAVPGGEIDAVYLRDEARIHAIHEGLVQTIGDYRFSYQKETPPPVARYTLSAIDPGGNVRREVALGPGDRARVGSWVLALSEENPLAPSGAAIEATRRPGGFAQGLGLVLFLGGSFGLVFARFGGRSQA